MGSCKEVVRLASKGLHSKLTFWESMALSIHKVLCKPCRGFTHELQQLSDLAREKQLEFRQTEMGAERKERIQRAVDQQIIDSEK